MISALAATGLFPAILAAPAPQMNNENEQNTGPIAGVTPPIPTATAASGSLYGDESLLGEVAGPYPVSGGDSAIVSDYPLVSGQEADAKLGLYLDFNSVKNPQPLRGEGGQTDPGASTNFRSANMCMYLQVHRILRIREVKPRRLRSPRNRFRLCPQRPMAHGPQPQSLRQR